MSIQNDFFTVTYRLTYIKGQDQNVTIFVLLLKNTYHLNNIISGNLHASLTKQSQQTLIELTPEAWAKLTEEEQSAILQSNNETVESRLKVSIIS